LEECFARPNLMLWWRGRERRRRNSSIDLSWQIRMRV
jgi:hypothetical protein